MLYHVKRTVISVCMLSAAVILAAILCGCMVSNAAENDANGAGNLTGSNLSETQQINTSAAVYDKSPETGDVAEEIYYGIFPKKLIDKLNCEGVIVSDVSEIAADPSRERYEETRLRYYGIYHDRIVIYVRSNTDELGRIDAAGYTFTCPQGFGIYVFSDGELCYITKAYESGLLTEEDIGEIWKIDNQYTLAASERCGIDYARDNAATWGKAICSATVDDDFSDNEILVIVYPPYNRKEYVPEDFAEIGCTDVSEPSSMSNTDTLGRILLLTIEGNSKENVLSAICELENRDDIYSAEPNYIFYIDDDIF